MGKILKKKSDVEEITQHANKKKESTPKDKGLLIPSGSRMLNLACSDTSNGAFQLGKIVNLIGDSSSGKTLLALSMLSEVANRPEFDEYDLILDDAEEALSFDIKELFGSVLDERVNLSITSNTIEDYYGNVLRAIKKGQPFIYVLDSFDSITADEEIKRSKEYENNKAEKSGSYKTEKARMSSEILRVIKGGMKETNSLLFIISQTRDNIGFGAMFTPKVRTGGRALKFYCSHEIWLAVGKKHKKKGLEVGADVMSKVSKNKLTGKKREIQFPIYYDYGVDDLVSCVDFLIEQKVWTKSGSKITTNDLFPESTIAKLISTIEDEDREQEVLDLASETWLDREDAVKLRRKKKFA